MLFFSVPQKFVAVEIGKQAIKVKGDRVTLTNNEIKYIMKVIKSLENRGILIKGTTTKMTSQEGEFLNFLRLLMTAGLPLMKVYSLH